MSFDLVIKNGRVFDGVGNPWFYADVYVKDERIVGVSRIRLGEADVIIDAKGMILAPGFIDIHTHVDFTIFVNPRAESYIRQGVTTAGTGLCGLSAAPISDAHKDEWVEYMGIFAMGFKMPYDWRSFGEYLEKLEKTGLGINIWPQVGHGSLRTAVMGFEMRAPTGKEMNEMRTLMDQSLREGAWGLSSGLGYPPGCWAETSELIEMCKVVAKCGGIYTTHMRKPYKQGFREAVEIGEKTGVPVQVSHYEGKGVKETRERGVEVTYDSHPYYVGSSYLLQLLPYSGKASAIWEGGLTKLLERIKSEDIRQRLKKEIKFSRPTMTWDDMIVSFCKNKSSKKYVGKSIQEIAQSRGIHPVDTLCDLLLENNGIAWYIAHKTYKDNSVPNSIRNPNHIATSDGWALATYGPTHAGKPHPRCYGTFPRFLGKYVREEGVIPLEQMIRKMTSFPAQKMQIKDRGLIREGMYADIVVFDPERITDKATYDNPHQYPEGLEYVIENGKVVIEKGEHTGVLAGKVLRRHQCKSGSSKPSIP